VGAGVFRDPLQPVVWRRNDSPLRFACFRQLQSLVVTRSITESEASAILECLYACVLSECSIFTDQNDLDPSFRATRTHSLGQTLRVIG
jgi:hypothetical protein